MTQQLTMTKRQQWMQVLAQAGNALEAYAKELELCAYALIRAPETGMVMVRGAAGGTGLAFNLGEVTVTRCVVRLDDGVMGYSYVLGRSARQAELAAVVDGLLQSEQADQWYQRIVLPLRQAQQDQRLEREQEVAGSKVDFFTMVRGD